MRVVGQLASGRDERILVPLYWASPCSTGWRILATTTRGYPRTDEGLRAHLLPLSVPILVARRGSHRTDPYNGLRGQCWSVECPAHCAACRHGSSSWPLP